MPFAYVHNDNDRDYTEKFEASVIEPESAKKLDPKGEAWLTIPARGKVKMDRSEAVKFMGRMQSTQRLETGGYTVPKQLRLEPIGGWVPDGKQKIVCQMCKEEFQTEKSLSLHSDAEHAEAMLDEDAKKKAKRA